jgi:hypothetical protein
MLGPQVAIKKKFIHMIHHFRGGRTDVLAIEKRSPSYARTSTGSACSILHTQSREAFTLWDIKSPISRICIVLASRDKAELLSHDARY